VSARRNIFLMSLGGVVLVALALRLCYVLFAHPGIPLGYRTGDALYYQLEGASIQHGYGYMNPTLYLQNLAVGHFVEPDAEYAPMTALVLAGSDLLGFTTYFSHQILWCLIGTVTVAVLAFAAREIAGDAAGLVAGLVAAVYPGLWINDGMVESETLLELWVAVLIFLSLRMWKRPSWQLAVAVGSAAGMAAMARAEAILFLPLLVLPISLVCRERRRGGEGRKRKALYATVACLACLAVVSPWVGRNLIVYDKPVLALDEGQTLAGANDTATYYGGDIGGWDITSVLSRPAPLGDPSDQDSALRKIAIDYALAHKSRLPLVLAARFARMWGLLPTTVLGADYLEGRQRWASTWGLVMLYLMALPAAVTVLELRWRRISLLPLLAPLAVVTVTALVFYGDERLRADAEPAMVLLSTVTLASWTDLPTLFQTVRRGLHPRRLLGIGSDSLQSLGSVPVDDATKASFESASASSMPTTGGAAFPWGAVYAEDLGREILPARPDLEPTYRVRRFGFAGWAVVVAAVVFMGSLSYVNQTGRADSEPRSGLHMAQLLLSEQLTDQVTRVQYETPGHFSPYIGDGIQKVTTGNPKMTYTVETISYWKCTPLADLQSTVAVSWPGSRKPITGVVYGLTPLTFTPVPQIQC
jgi:hypothetical protein